MSEKYVFLGLPIVLFIMFLIACFVGDPFTRKCDAAGGMVVKGKCLRIQEIKL